VGAAGDTTRPAGTPTLFWLDVGGEVLRSNVTPFLVRTLVPSAGQGPDGIAVDLEAGHVYWTTMGDTAQNDGSIRRSNLDGSGMVTVVPEGDTFTPKQLKLEPVTRQLYWADREGMQVQRSNLDGSELETLYTSGSGSTDRQDLSKHCVGIAVDVAGGYFYWSQKGSDNGHVGSLRRARLVLPAGESSENRSDVEVLYDGLPEPIDIDLDVEHGLIYWTDRGDDTVNRGPIEIPAGSTAMSRTDREILVEDVREAIGLTLDHARGFVYYTSAVGDVGRARLDGSEPESLLADGGAFTGIVIVDVP
jgi:DNA-binding beta-propeller fold protein YncE